jgi:hypothetical protein
MLEGKSRNRSWQFFFPLKLANASCRQYILSLFGMPKRGGEWKEDKKTNNVSIFLHKSESMYSYYSVFFPFKPTHASCRLYIVALFGMPKIRRKKEEEKETNNLSLSSTMLSSRAMKLPNIFLLLQPLLKSQP